MNIFITSPGWLGLPSEEHEQCRYTIINVRDDSLAITVLAEGGRPLMEVLYCRGKFQFKADNIKKGTGGGTNPKSSV